MADRDTFIQNLNDPNNPWLSRAHADFIDGYECRQEAEFSGKVDVIDAVQAKAFTEQWKQSRTDERARRWERNSTKLSEHIQRVNANLANDAENGHLTAWTISLDKENRMSVTHARMRQSKIAVRNGLQRSRALLELMSTFKSSNPPIPAIQQETTRRAREIWDLLQNYSALSNTITAEGALLNSFQTQAKALLPPSDDPLYRFEDWRIQIDVMYVNNWLDKIRDYKVQLGLNLYTIGMMLHLHNHVHMPERISNKSRRDDQKLWIKKMRELERLEKWRGPQHQINATLEQLQGCSDRIGENSKLTIDLDIEITNLLVPVFTVLGPMVGTAAPLPQPQFQTPQPQPQPQARGFGSDPISPVNPQPQQQQYAYEQKQTPRVNVQETQPPPGYTPAQAQTYPQAGPTIIIQRTDTVHTHDDGCDDFAKCCVGCGTAAVCCPGGCPCPCLLCCTIM